MLARFDLGVAHNRMSIDGDDPSPRSLVERIRRWSEFDRLLRYTNTFSFSAYRLVNPSQRNFNFAVGVAVPRCPLGEFFLW